MCTRWHMLPARSCDTISLRRASLNPETIRMLMLVKQRLRLARTTIQDILRDHPL